MLCDAVVIYSQLDREAAEKFVRDSVGYAGQPIEIRLFDDGQFRDPVHAVDSSALCFVYLTKNLVDDGSLMSVLDYVILRSVAAQNWKIVPLFTERRNETFRVPISLCSLKGIPYYGDDELYRRGFSALMNDAVNKRRRADGMYNLMPNVVPRVRTPTADVVRPTPPRYTGIVTRRVEPAPAAAATTRSSRGKIVMVNVDDKPTDNEDLQCKICFENERRIAVLDCGHTMCGDCTKQTVVNTGECPYCRQKAVSVIKLYFA